MTDDLTAALHTEQERAHRYLARAERAEAERDAAQRESEEQARLLGMSGSREAALLAERDALREVVRAAVEIASRICAASDGIGVINAVAELRPMLPKMRGVLYDLDAARAKVPK